MMRNCMQRNKIAELVLGAPRETAEMANPQAGASSSRSYQSAIRARIEVEILRFVRAFLLAFGMIGQFFPGFWFAAESVDCGYLTGWVGGGVAQKDVGTAVAGDAGNSGKVKVAVEHGSDGVASKVLKRCGNTCFFDESGKVFGKAISSCSAAAFIVPGISLGIGKEGSAWWPIFP
jgi:hypothetical protein